MSQRDQLPEENIAGLWKTASASDSPFGKRKRKPQTAGKRRGCGIGRNSTPIDTRLIAILSVEGSLVEGARKENAAAAQKQKVSPILPFRVVGAGKLGR